MLAGYKKKSSTPISHIKMESNSYGDTMPKMRFISPAGIPLKSNLYGGAKPKNVMHFCSRNVSPRP